MGGGELRRRQVVVSGLRVQLKRLFFTEARPEELTPQVMVLLAQHLARHRLREPQLLEAIAHFLVVQEAQLNSKVGPPPTFTAPLLVILRHPLKPTPPTPIRPDGPLLPAAGSPR